MRPLYRLQQLMRTIRSKPDPRLLNEATQILPPNQLLLFRSMKPADQAHSVRVMHSLRQLGESDPNLLAAALLHDVGKTRHPLQVWERALIVLCRALFPDLVNRVGQIEPTGWQRPFVIAKQHPLWGAEMVAKVGGSERLVKLIEIHQDEPASLTDSDMIKSLRALQAADNRN